MRDALLLWALRHLLLSLQGSAGAKWAGGGSLTSALLFISAMHGALEAFQ